MDVPKSNIQHMQVNHIDNATDLSAIKDSWDELYNSIPPPQGHPFNCFSWLFPYAKLLERQGRPWQIFTVLDGERLVGIAPLLVAGTWLFGFKRVRFLGHLFSDYCDFMYRQDYEQLVADTLLRHWQSVFGSNVIFDLNRIPESSPTPILLRTAIAEQEGQFYEIPWDRAPCLNLTNGGRETLDTILSKKHCRQRIREMGKLGDVQFLLVGDKEEMEPHLERFFVYHRLRWHEKSTFVPSMSEDMQEVYTASICQMAKEGHAEVVSLAINDLPYAYAVVLKKDKYYCYLMPTHNIFAPYSPGTALLYNIFKYMKDTEYKELDFSIGEEPYKARFSNMVRQNRRIFLTFGSPPAFKTMMKLIGAVRSDTTLMDCLRSVRTKSGQVKYSVSDYFSRRLSKLKRLDYNGIKPHGHGARIFAKGSCLIYRLDLAASSNLGGPENGFQIRKIPVTQAIEFISEFHQSNSPAVWGDLIKREIEGAECYGRFIDDRLIHTSWVTDQKRVWITEIGQALELEDGESCIFDCNTLRGFRGQGAYTQTLRHIAKVKERLGYKSIYIYTLSSNTSSIKGIENAKFELAEIRQHRTKKHQMSR